MAGSRHEGPDGTTAAHFAVPGIAASEGCQGDDVLDLSDCMPPVSTALVGARERLDAIRPVPVIRAHLTATAKAAGVALGTRNASDAAGGEPIS